MPTVSFALPVRLWRHVLLFCDELEIKLSHAQDFVFLRQNRSLQLDLLPLEIQLGLSNGHIDPRRFARLHTRNPQYMLVLQLLCQ